MKPSPPPDVQLRKYLAALPAASRRHLALLRTAIKAAAPGAAEGFGYGMPAFTLEGKGLVWYAAWKRHSGLYPVSTETSLVLSGELAAFETTGKGTIRFPIDKPPPVKLVTRLVKARIAELQARKVPR